MDFRSTDLAGKRRAYTEAVYTKECDAPIHFGSNSSREIAELAIFSGTLAATSLWAR
jgi:hypothetical protein